MIKFADWKVGQVYLVDDEITMLCIGIDVGNCTAVLASFYADDEDLDPELHVHDGVDTYNMLEEYDNIKPLNANKYRIVALSM